MNPEKIIGLVGYKGSGKDLFADYLVDKYGYEKISVAEPLKKACAILFSLEDKYFQDQDLKEQVITEWGMSPRQMMQIVGTDLLRNRLYQDFWVRHFRLRIQQSIQKGSTKIVCPDIRFQNEADVVKQYGGLNVYIDRFAKRKDTHASETLDIHPLDLSITNKSTVADFYSMIDHHLVNLWNE